MPHPMNAFDGRWSLPRRAAAGEPLFLLASGWRTGSTLLQRMLSASGEVLVWGEPYGRAAWIPALSTVAHTPDDAWPTKSHFASDGVFDDLGDYWIANLYPPPNALKQAHASFLDALLRDPALARGFARFGLKEVRLAADHARFLRWVYPDARFVFMTRNPWDAWASARGGRWWLRLPDRSIQDARQFAEHWRTLTASYLDWAEDDGLLLRYEDLVRPDFDLAPLREHCRLETLDAGVRNNVLRGIEKPRHELPLQEVELIRTIVGEVAEALGYSPPRVGPPVAPTRGTGLANLTTLG